MRRPKGNALVKNERRMLAVALALHEAGEHEFHGYALATALEAHGLPSMSYSTVYRCLGRLAERGMLTSRSDTVDAGGPPRRIYRLTGTGLATASTLALDPAPAWRPQ
jgi:DNA-binding PadR family transcriptional regulator